MPAGWWAAYKPHIPNCGIFHVGTGWEWAEVSLKMDGMQKCSTYPLHGQDTVRNNNNIESIFCCLCECIACMPEIPHWNIPLIGPSLHSRLSALWAVNLCGWGEINSHYLELPRCWLGSPAVGAYDTPVYLGRLPVSISAAEKNLLVTSPLSPTLFLSKLHCAIGLITLGQAYRAQSIAGLLGVEFLASPLRSSLLKLVIRFDRIRPV